MPGHRIGPYVHLMLAPGDSVGYIIRVAGHLDSHWSAWFADFVLTRDQDGTTSLEGIVDQAALHALLAKVRDLGVVLLSVEIAGTPSHHINHSML